MTLSVSDQVPPVGSKLIEQTEATEVPDRIFDFSVGCTCGFGGGGMHGKRALGGTFLGGCVYSGRIAARAIRSGRGVR